MRVHIPAIAAAVGLCPHPALAQTPDPFFAGKTINLIIGFGPGGTYDYYARLVARHLGKHIPGKPNVIAQQMAGAGSFTAANYLYAVAPKDGTAMGTSPRPSPSRKRSRRRASNTSRRSSIGSDGRPRSCRSS